MVKVNYLISLLAMRKMRMTPPKKRKNRGSNINRDDTPENNIRDDTATLTPVPTVSTLPTLPTLENNDKTALIPVPMAPALRTLENIPQFLSDGALDKIYQKLDMAFLFRLRNENRGFLNSIDRLVARYNNLDIAALRATKQTFLNAFKYYAYFIGHDNPIINILDQYIAKNILEITPNDLGKRITGELEELEKLLVSHTPTITSVDDDINIEHNASPLNNIRPVSNPPRITSVGDNANIGHDASPLNNIQPDLESFKWNAIIEKFALCVLVLLVSALTYAVGRSLIQRISERETTREVIKFLAIGIGFSLWVCSFFSRQLASIRRTDAHHLNQIVRKTNHDIEKLIAKRSSDQINKVDIPNRDDAARMQYLWSYSKKVLDTASTQLKEQDLGALRLPKETINVQTLKSSLGKKT